MRFLRNPLPILHLRMIFRCLARLGIALVFLGKEPLTLSVIVWIIDRMVKKIRRVGASLFALHILNLNLNLVVLVLVHHGADCFLQAVESQLKHRKDLSDLTDSASVRPFFWHHRIDPDRMRKGFSNKL